jgi:hypothetical protein
VIERPALAALPGGYVDQVARRERFERDHPDARFSHCAPTWTGSILVCRRRREVRRPGLEPLLDALEALATIEAERLAIEADVSGWHVWLSNLDRWWAVRTGADATHGRDDQRPMTIDADDATGLRKQLAAMAAPEPQP